ncbi:MAG: helix-turn-helix transcriptional regulator [Chthonomonas sp.]|nr:helix-turn-helix transcriptional regulator [Chthonomonas sp.]
MWQEPLRELRESRGLSQRELARKLDRTQAFVWKVEQGIQHLDIPTLIDMTRVLGTTASGLLQGVEAALTQS